MTSLTSSSSKNWKIEEEKILIRRQKASRASKNKTMEDEKEKEKKNSRKFWNKKIETKNTLKYSSS